MAINFTIISQPVKSIIGDSVTFTVNAIDDIDNFVINGINITAGYEWFDTENKLS